MSTVHFSLKTKIALVVTVLLWASAFTGIRAGLESFTPGALAALRFMIASVCMALICLYLPKRAMIPLRDKFLLLVVGAIGLGLYNIALNYGELSIPSGIASFIVSQSPIVTAMLAIFFLSESFNRYLIFGTVISIFGVGLITLGCTHQFNLTFGVFEVLCAMLIGGIYSVAQKPFLKQYHPIEVTAYIIWGCALSLICYLPSAFHELVKASFESTASVIYLGIFPAAMGYATWSFALREIPASKAASFLYFLPVIALFLGWVCLHEIPASLSIIGGVIAMMGVWVVNRSKTATLVNKLNS